MNITIVSYWKLVIEEIGIYALVYCVLCENIFSHFLALYYSKMK